MQNKITNANISSHNFKTRMFIQANTHKTCYITIQTEMTNNHTNNYSGINRITF